MHGIETDVWILLALAGFAAGWTDAVVGGGGLIQLPSLLLAFPQAAPIHILATNKLASVFGTTSASVTYLRRVRIEPATAMWLVGSAFVGSIAGAIAASHVPREAFNPVVLVALLVVGTYTVLTPTLGMENLPRFGAKHSRLIAAAIGLVVGCYDGVLGPGTGSFFVFALVGILGYGFLEASAKAKLANTATNIAALVVFVPQSAVMWSIGLTMAVANIAGSWFGARTAVARGSGFVRIVFLIVVAAFSVRIGYDIVA